MAAAAFRRGEQEILFDLEELHAKAAEVEAEWQSAAEREKASGPGSLSARSAGRGSREVAAIWDALGGPGEVRDFVEESLRALGGLLRPTDDGFTVDFSATPVGLRNALAPLLGAEAVESGRPIPFRDTAAVARGEAALVRTDPVVSALASYILDSALDTHMPGPRPARRCGVVRTDAVTRMTTLILARYRFHLNLPSRSGTRQLVAEDARLLAFTGSPASPEWLDHESAIALLDAEAAKTLTRCSLNALSPVFCPV